MDKYKRRKHFSLPIYSIVFIYVFLAIGITIQSVASINHAQIFNILIASILLILIQIKPIKYYLKEDHLIYFTFIYPILIIFGILPIIILEVFSIFYQNRQFKRKHLIKRVYNSSSGIVSSALTIYLMNITESYIQFYNSSYLIAIIFYAIFYSMIQILSVSIVVYLDTGFKFKFYTLNVYASNISNGIITFYLYQSLGLLGIFISIGYAYILSHRSKYLEQLYKKKAENRLRMIFETIDYGIMMLDLNKQVKMANQLALKTLDQDGSQLIGRRINQLLAPYPDEILHMIEWTYERKKTFQHKNLPIPNGDNTIYIDLFTYPYYISEQEFAGIILVYKNVTDNFLIRRQLIEADKLSHIGEIAAGKVHEIRNPLATVRGYLQFLKHLVTKGEQINMNYFDIALQEIDRTNELIGSLLILAKQSDQQFKRVPIHSVIENVLHLLAPQIEQKNINITKDIQNELYMNGNENYLKQIFLNLILNGIDAVEFKEKKRIGLKAHQNSSNIIIEIEDNGDGILPEDIEKLSMPFFTTKESGTGLGLSITYKLIEEHHGQIYVESQPENGTIFKLIFPAYK